VRALVRGPWGWFPLLTIVAGISALMLATAYNMARLNLGGAEVLFWIAFPIGVLPIAAILLRPNRARRERIALIVLLGIEMVMPDLLRSPSSFNGYDELLHLRSLEDILRFGHLFHPNPLLTVSPFFPSLEIVASAIAQLSGADPFATSVVLLGFIRILFASALFLLFEEVSASARLAGVAALIYILNPSFAFFDGAFAYESLALPLIPIILLVVARWARSGSTSWGRMPGLLLAVLLVTLIISHHITSFGMAGLLIAWAGIQQLIRHRDRYAASTAMVALVATLGVLVWLFSVASLTLGYLFPPLSGAVRQMVRLIMTGEGRQLFQAATGEVAPLWQRFAGLGATGLLLAGLPIGIGVVWRRMRGNSLALLLTLLALGYPASLVLRLTPTGSEAAGRSSAMIFLGLAFVVALGIGSLGDLSGWLLRRLHLPARLAATTPWRVVGVAAFGVLVIGCVIVGTPPATRLPGPYLVGADARSIDAESIAAATWARAELGIDRRFAADRVNRLLLGSYGVEHVVFQHSEGIESWQLFLSPSIGVNERARLTRLRLQYLLIDRRLSQSLPLSGFYYEEGEVAQAPHTTPISAAVLGKWDANTAADRIFDSGNLQIYDVRRLSHAP
jgi:hypothetical protein